MFLHIDFERLENFVEYSSPNGDLYVFTSISTAINDTMKKEYSSPNGDLYVFTKYNDPNAKKAVYSSPNGDLYVFTHHLKKI